MLLRRLNNAFVHLLRPSARGCQWQPAATVRFREASGGPSGLLFPHRVYYLPKAGPNALHLASRMCGTRQFGRFWEVLLHANGAASEVRHYGMTDLVASASLIQEGRRLYGLNYLPDSWQGASRRSEDSFQGWPGLLLNAVLQFAVERKIQQVYSPKSRLVREQATFAEVPCGWELLETVYDRAVTGSYLFTETPDWWILDVSRNAGHLVPLTLNQDVLRREKTVCLFHDIERGLGQTGENAGFGLEVDREAPHYLRRMLAAEREAGVKATYNVVGCLLDEVRGEIEQDGHSVAFHSFDHDLTKSQLDRCRSSNGRIKGYRAPKSILTRELSDANLARHGFDWLAIAASSVGAAVPVLRDGVVWIPVLLDDYGLHKRRTDYKSWERDLLSRVARARFAAIGLHDCYAGYWLDRYEEFLGKLKTLGRFSTMDEVAWTMILASAA